MDFPCSWGAHWRATYCYWETLLTAVLLKYETFKSGANKIYILWLSVNRRWYKRSYMLSMSKYLTKMHNCVKVQFALLHLFSCQLSSFYTIIIIIRVKKIKNERFRLRGNSAIRMVPASKNIEPLNKTGERQWCMRSSACWWEDELGRRPERRRQRPPAAKTRRNNGFK